VTTNTDVVVAEGHVRIGIIGAGVAGLTTAKVLLQAGHDVVVYDRVDDVGGVWSASRRYPGLTTQSPRAQYSFSDFPMGRDLPEWPAGAQVQGYLAAYADHFGVTGHLRLGTDVRHATPLVGLLQRDRPKRLQGPVPFAAGDLPLRALAADGEKVSLVARHVRQACGGRRVVHPLESHRVGGRQPTVDDNVRTG